MDRLSQAKEYSLLVSSIKDMEHEIRELKKKRDEMEADLIEWFTSPDSPDRLSIGGRTLYPMRKVYARVNGEAGIGSLKQHGLSDMVKETVNGNTLSAWYREMEQEGPLPEWVQDAVVVSEQYKIGTRKES